MRNLDERENSWGKGVNGPSAKPGTEFRKYNPPISFA
jgi:hypothetical protein